MNKATAAKVVITVVLLGFILSTAPDGINPFSRTTLSFTFVESSSNAITQVHHKDFFTNVEDTDSGCPRLSNLLKGSRVKDERVQIVTDIDLAATSKLSAEECAKMQFSPSNPPAMNNPDRNSFQSFLKQKQAKKPCMTYVEWGSGGSTFWATSHAARVLSIENHPGWCKKMLENQEIQCSILQGKLVYACVDGGPVGDWGRPTNLSTYHSQLYINVLDQFYMHPDFVLVDGRYRVATALTSLKTSKNDSFLVIHDYYNRKGYWEVEKFFTTVPSYQKQPMAVLGVFQKKPEIDSGLLDVSIEKFSSVDD